MQNRLDLLFKDESLQLEGIPNAVKAVAVRGPLAKRLAHLGQHEGDISFVIECLKLIEITPENPYVLREALWRSAIITYAKCFGISKARFQLSAEKLFKNAPAQLVFHRQILALRNKHFIHDENPYGQCLVGAAVNDGSGPKKIEQILCLNISAISLKPEHYSSFCLLINTIQPWLNSEINSMYGKIADELEKEPIGDLLARDMMTFHAPSLEDADRTKKIIN